MNKTIISAKNAPAAIGPYSQGVKLGNLVFTSGQIPADPASGAIVSGGIETQTRQAIKNLEAVLNAAGTKLDHILKTTLYIQDMDDFAAINEIYASFFAAAPPARSCIEAARLPKDVLIEIEAVAYIP